MAKGPKEKDEVIAKYATISAWALPVTELIKQIGRVILALIK